MNHLFADATDVITKGAQYGPLGWVLAVIAAGFAAYMYLVYVPDRAQQREHDKKRFEADQKRADAEQVRSEEMKNAVVKLCDVTGETHQAVTGLVHAVGESQQRESTILIALRALTDAAKLINDKVGKPASEHLAESSAALKVLGNGTGEMPSLSGTKLAPPAATKGTP